MDSLNCEHAPAYHAFVPRQVGPGIDTADATRTDDKESRARIRCPRCEWAPGRSARWCCLECPLPVMFFDGCGTEWNTFDTRGRCPGCQHQWRWTSCLVCTEWSLHDDWYVEDSEA